MGNVLHLSDSHCCLARKPAPLVEDELILTVLRTIRDAQENGFFADGRVCSSFAIARQEIEVGAKKSHWMWYVWPSLSCVRSNVRYPQFLLPNLDAARAYVMDPVLAERLVSVTQMATAHLKAGVNPRALFGKQHKYDVPKFREAMIVFAVAAQLNGNETQKDIFLDGLRALGAQALDDNTFEVLNKTSASDEVSAIQQEIVTVSSRQVEDHSCEKMSGVKNQSWQRKKMWS